MNLEDILLRGTRTAQPLATSVANGTLYYVTDQFVLEQSNGISWITYSGSSNNASGQNVTGLLALDGQDGLDSFMMGPQGLVGPVGPAGSSASAAWAFIATAAASGASVTFNNLGAYSEIMAVLVAVTATGACIRQLQVSSDNGVSYYSTSGDYISMDQSGAPTNGTSLSFDNGNDAFAHTCWIIISLFNIAYIKPANSSFPTTNLVAMVNKALALNAIKIKTSSNTFNGGNIYVFGR